MVNIEVTVISRYTIKPSTASSSPHLLQPYKLSIFDQLTPNTYVPTIFFYRITVPSFNLPQTLIQLRNSLSETLTLYYPLSGRIKNNLYVHDFDAGVPYLEAQVNCPMLEFLKLRETEWLNHFVPVHPFLKEMDSELLPLIACQANIFDGGIAMGISLSHKLADGVTANAFLKTWAAIFRGCRQEIIYPNLFQASLVFPPRDNLPKRYVALMERLWFEQKKDYVTRRFLFDAKAISALQAKAKSEPVPKPSRIEALTCFLWKHQMAASRASSSGTSPKLSIVAHAVNLRPRMNPQMLLDNTIGNIILWAPVLLDILEETAPQSGDHELCDLVNMLHESLNEFNNEYLETLKGKEGFGAICDLLDLMEEGTSIKPPPEIYAFTSWTRILNKLDFGWGKPFQIGVIGKVGPVFRNLTIFVQCDQEIEAWVTLEEKQMAMLEKDSQFLAFASPNP
ncbi:putative alcohol O-acetyltransferase [Rosa chinensis]|uniref:Putative alcohol O-acetyltransferase n=1 Tax=Rosa chinensis TaxID=74649 RepID=A0A2P6SGK7_ROSCH|nr:stemmadenine O-acetyltransferase [Rosa chinensis]PRQ57817.1 putative alcohol O-acetyltransferase [Rosa chinensis]